MTKLDLTYVEEIIFKMWKEEFKIDDDDEPTILRTLTVIRERIKESAYHEAGHFVARLFVSLQDFHILSVSIISNDERSGHVMCGSGYAEHHLDEMSPNEQRYNGYRLLLVIFAGLGSVMIMNNSEHETLFDYLDEEDPEVLMCDIDIEGSDISRAKKTAKILSRPYMPDYRILFMAAKWTLEMLRIPAVWNAVEKVTELLMSKGEITNENDEISNLIKTLNVPRAENMPKWRRRIYG